jgi:hypothetical protein
MGHPRTGQLSLVNIPRAIHDHGRFGKAGLPEFLGCRTCCRPNGVGCAVAAAAPGEKQSDDAGTQPGSSPKDDSPAFIQSTPYARPLTNDQLRRMT